MKNFIGKKVHIETLDYSVADRNGMPSQLAFEGIVRNVRTNLIEVIGCTIVKSLYVRQGTPIGTSEDARWFNTQASTLISIDVLGG